LPIYSLTAELVSDTAFDLHAVSWNPKIEYTAATDRSGTAIDLVKRPLAFDMTPEVAQFPQRTLTPAVPFSASGRHVGTAHLDFTVGPNANGGTAVVSIKTRDGVIARNTVNLPAVPAGLGGAFATDAHFNINLPAGDLW